MTQGIIARKLGMTRVFDEDGSATPVTVLEAGPCPVVAVRTDDVDGYTATQIAGEPVAEKKLSRPALGHLKAAKVEPHRRLVEVRGMSGHDVGSSVTVEAFEEGQKIKVTGTSIGKGFQGTIKRHNFGRGPMSHGSHNKRAPGSIGASATPSRVMRGKKMPGHMGAATVTQRGLKVVRTDAERNLLLVKGSVPGPNNAYLLVVTD